MTTIRILTDTSISQSSRWMKATTVIQSSSYVILKRWIPSLADVVFPLLALVYILRRMHDYDVVITAHIRVAHLLGFLRKALRIHVPKHIVLELMLDEEQSHLRWKIKRRIQRWCFETVECIFVSSTREVSTYAARLNLDQGKVRFLPFHTNIAEPSECCAEGNYLLAAGRTGRDYAVLIEAVRSLDVEVRIVCNKESIDGLDVPPHVKVFSDVQYSTYLQLLRNCRFVIVPLKELVKSTGQVVILEAMALGKPVIATRTTGTLDYIQPGSTGILVPPCNSSALREAVETLLERADLHRLIALNSLEAVRRYHTLDRYIDVILDTASDLSNVSTS